MSRIAGITVALLLTATVAWAQEWKGDGRLMGKVVDEQGKPLEGVLVSASLPAFHGILAQGKSDRKGDWTVDDVAEGNWELLFELEGYLPGKGSCDVDETGRSSPIRTTLKKAFDPNAFIQQEGKRASALMGQKKYAEARTVYEGITAKVPQVAPQMQQFIAQAYYMEGNFDKAAEILKGILAKDASNPQAKLLLLSVYTDSGAIADAGQLLASIDESKIKDPGIYNSLGISLMKQKNAVEALKYFEKAVARFPQAPESYNYRAHALIELVNAQKDPKDPERIARLEQIKADLTKFLQLAPNSPDADYVKKLLADVEKQTNPK